jgi:hypothetical protein
MLSDAKEAVAMRGFLRAAFLATANFWCKTCSILKIYGNVNPLVFQSKLLSKFALKFYVMQDKCTYFSGLCFRRKEVGKTDDSNLFPFYSYAK